ncbi:MAG: HD domain-containing protein [Candidatus Omnitrophica bacterium]|nr:HD domain-containing protein [Candidatus Omnitrophota bacterium]
MENQEIDQLRAELKQTTERLIELENMSMFGDIAGGIAHELNQPLNVTKIICQGILHDIQKGRFSEQEVKNDLPEIVKQMDRLAEIVKHMRVLIRAKDKIFLEKQDINAIVQSALLFVAQQYKDHKIDIVLSLASGLPYIMADSVRFEQMVLNLISQARRKVERSEQKVKKITLKSYASGDGKEVIFEICDNCESSSIVKDQGDSLRFVASQKIISDQQARLEFEQTADTGGVFKIIFPAVIKTVV